MEEKLFDIDTDKHYSDWYVHRLKRAFSKTRNENYILRRKLIIYRVMLVLLLALTMFIIIYNDGWQTKSSKKEPTTIKETSTQYKNVVLNEKPKVMTLEYVERNQNLVCSGQEDTQQISNNEEDAEEEEAMIGGYYISEVINGEATAYDLSVQCCGKTADHEAYGITATGFDVSNKSRSEAMCIAVDPSVIPLYSKVYVEFIDSEYQKYNGIYTALDTGSAVVGNRIDIFMGDFQSESPNQKTLDFGKVECTITILSEERSE